MKTGLTPKTDLSPEAHLSDEMIRSWIPGPRRVGRPGSSVRRT